LNLSKWKRERAYKYDFSSSRGATISELMWELRILFILSIVPLAENITYDDHVDDFISLSIEGFVTLIFSSKKAKNIYEIIRNRALGYRFERP
jgi:Cdc6-like AAA superfamily ATPase